MLYKTFFLMGLVGLVLIPENYRTMGFLAVGVMLLLGALIVGFLRLRERGKIKFRRPLAGGIVLFWCILLLPVFYWQLNRLEIKGPPRALFHYGSSDKPEYRRGLQLEAELQKTVKPGLYLARVRVLGEYKPPKRRYKYKKRRGRWKKRKYKKRAYNRKYKSRNYKRKYKGNYKSGSYKRKYKRNYKRKYKRNYKRKYKRPYRKKRPYRFRKKRRRRKPLVLLSSASLKQAQGETFPMLIKINDYKLHGKCRLKIRSYGRGVARELGPSGYDGWLRRKGARAMMRISSRYHLESRTCGPPGRRDRLRGRLRALLEEGAGLKGRERAVSLGVLLGASGMLDREFKGRVRRLGLLHLFAASGLHLAIFFGVLYWPLSKLLGRKHPLALLLPLPLCLSYLWLLDFPVSLTRAFIFLSLYALENTLHRPLTVTDRLVNAGLIVIFVMPAEFISLSGMLSFSAVAGILYFFPTLRKALKGRGGSLRDLLVSNLGVSLSAGLFTLPLQLYFFGGYSFLSPLANFILVPLMSLILPILYGGLLLESIGLGFGLYRDLCVFALQGFTWLVNFLTPYALYYRFQSLWALPVAAGLVLLLILWMIRRGPEGRAGPRSQKVIFLCIAILGPVGAMVVDLSELARVLWKTYPYIL